MTHLCQATEEELTLEYKEERDRLTHKLKNGLVPKEKNGTVTEVLYPHVCKMLEVFSQGVLLLVLSWQLYWRFW